MLNSTINKSLGQKSKGLLEENILTLATLDKSCSKTYLHP